MQTAPLLTSMLCLVGWLCPALADAPAIADAPADDAVLTTIAFGSCAYQDEPQPIWRTIARHDPDLFLFIGDNVYGDLVKRNRATAKDLRAAYATLGQHEDFTAFRAAVPMLATWDDHDYGLNDAGAELPFKQEAQQAFHDFFATPADDPRREREGIYHAVTFGPEGKRVQVILLDTRYFRSPLRRGRMHGKRAWVPDDSPDKTLLGEAQWAWLETPLREPAEVRLVVSSIQVVDEEHRFEKWANLPRQRKRLFDLIAETEARGVVFLSGDRHLTELSIDADAGPYPMVDLTSSGLTQGNEGEVDEPNRHRVGKAIRKTNFGLVHIDWAGEAPTLRLETRDDDDAVLVQHAVDVADLRPGRAADE